MARTPHPHTDRDLLARIARSAGGKAGYKQLIRELGLGGGRERRLLIEQLTRMVAQGEPVLTREQMWSVPKPDTRSDAAAQTGSAAPRANSTTHRFGLWEGMEAAVRSGRDRLVSGRLDLHRDGFGFVRPEAISSRTATGGRGKHAGAGKSSSETGPNSPTTRQRQEDIFIPPNGIHGAMQGDLVLVDEAPADRDGRRSGSIARVLTRRNPTIVGIFHYARFADRSYSSNSASLRGNFVSPIDERLGGPILIPGGEDLLPSASVESPHRTLGGEARGSTYVDDSKDARFPLEGLAVDVEITSFPSSGRPAFGRVIEVLGPPDAFGVDVEIIIRKHHIPHTFPSPVLAEAADRALESVGSIAAEALENREDFRGLPIVTIDGETARDFDDAVLVRNLANGNNELQVHIADVSWYVRPGSALDTEARLRGTSVYFPDRAVPMLPHELSSGICSLLPNEDRLVLSCIMEIDREGEIVGFRVVEGIIRSVQRMTYTSVQQCLNVSELSSNRVPKTAFLSKKEGFKPALEDIAERERIGLEHPELPAAFYAMLELALRLNAKRVRRGSIDFDLPEPIVEFDPDGNMKAIVRSERGWAHRLIEEFMLSANECIATWLEQQAIPSIYRIHEMPDPKRIVEFEEMAAGFGHSLGIGTLPVRKLTMKADRRESRQHSARGKDSRAAQKHEIPESIPVTPQMYQRLVRRISGTPEERILSYLMLRSLKQARYAESNEGHFALASPSYTHFTSPIRRYPDLTVHRLVRAMLRRGADPRGGPIRSEDAQPWAAEVLRGRRELGPVQTHANRRFPSGMTEREANAEERRAGTETAAPIAAEELNDIAVESSQAERRAADAERELIEWKKMKFMADKIGDDFPAVILSVTKYGFFVELDDMFIEGLVPLASLVGDYSFRDTDRTIVGSRSGHVFALGQRVQVLLDRIDRQQRRLQFALLPGTEPKATTGAAKDSVRGGKSEAKKAKASGKTKARQRKKR